MGTKTEFRITEEMFRQDTNAPYNTTDMVLKESFMKLIQGSDMREIYEHIDFKIINPNSKESQDMLRDPSCDSFEKERLINLLESGTRLITAEWKQPKQREIKYHYNPEWDN
jgi:hypothetical protein